MSGVMRGSRPCVGPEGDSRCDDSRCAYVWGVLHRTWNKLQHILHGNTSFPGIAAFSEDARLGLALLGGGAFNSIDGFVDRDIRDGGSDGFHECEEALGTTGALQAGLDVEFDIQKFRNAHEGGPVVISLATALGEEAILRMDAACSMAPVPPHGVPGLDGPSCEFAQCLRCGFRLTPCVCSGAPCFQCAQPPTPQSRGFCCDQCGVQICSPCTRGMTSVEGAVVAYAAGARVIDGFSGSLEAQADQGTGEVLLPCGVVGLGPFQSAEGQDLLYDGVASQPGAVTQDSQQDALGSVSRRRRRRKRLCGGCDRALRGRMLEEPEPCTFCLDMLPADTRVFGCLPCGTTQCMSCSPLVEQPELSQSTVGQGLLHDAVASQLAPATQDIDELLVEAAGAVRNSDVVFDSDPRQWSGEQVEGLLQLLRRFPDVCPLSGLRHPPRDMEQRWATILACIMEWHAEVCDKSSMEESRRELADLLLRNLWAVFFRATGRRDTFCPDDDEKEQWKCHMDDAASSRTTVRKRLELAEAGLWGKLLEELGVDVRAEQAERVRRGAEAGGQARSPEDVWLNTANQVITNTLDGNIKGAARKLRPQGVHPPTPEAFELVKGKFRTEGRTIHWQIAQTWWLQRRLRSQRVWQRGLSTKQLKGSSLGKLQGLVDGGRVTSNH